MSTILSAAASITRYKINGKIDEGAAEVRECLERKLIKQPTDSGQKQVVGWAGFLHRDEPACTAFDPQFIGKYIVFVLRVDKKTIPGKVLKQAFNADCQRRLEETGRDFLSRAEKKQIREHVETNLLARTPITPHAFDVVLDTESNEVWLYTANKTAREELERLFFECFGVSLMPLCPYFLWAFSALTNDADIDHMDTLSPLDMTAQAVKGGASC